MKRLWISAALFAAVCGLCVASLLYQRTQVRALLSLLDTADQCYEQHDYPGALDAAEHLRDEYDRRTKLFSCFISHNDLTASRETVAVLPATLRLREPDEFPVESARCRAQLEKLYSIELPTLPNIF